MRYLPYPPGDENREFGHELIWQMHLLVRKRFCRSADRFSYSESRFLIGKAGIPACKIDCRSGTGPSRFENPFAGSQSHFPIGKVVSQSAKSFPDQQSCFPAGKVVCQSAKSLADRQSHSPISRVVLLISKVIPRSAKSFPNRQSCFPISEVVSCAAKAFPDQQSHFPIGKAISWFARAVLGRRKYFSPFNSLGFNAIESSASRNLRFSLPT